MLARHAGARAAAPPPACCRARLRRWTGGRHASSMAHDLRADRSGRARGSPPAAPPCTGSHLAIAILAEVAARCLRASAGFTKPLPSAVVVVGYVVAVRRLALALKLVPVGVGYAIWPGAGVTPLTGIDRLFLGRKLDLAAHFGIGLIVVGVVVRNGSSPTVPR